MKKIFLILVVVLIGLFLFGCTQFNSALVGTWTTQTHNGWGSSYSFDNSGKLIVDEPYFELFDTKIECVNPEDQGSKLVYKSCTFEMIAKDWNTDAMNYLTQIHNASKNSAYLSDSITIGKAFDKSELIANKLVAQLRNGFELNLNYSINGNTGTFELYAFDTTQNYSYNPGGPNTVSK